MIIDGFNRVHDYLRISLTDNCNLRCFYCMPEEEYEFTPASKLMQAEEIEAIAKVFVANGVNKLKREDNAFIVITHYQRLLNYVVPDFVHVLYKRNWELYFLNLSLL